MITKNYIPDLPQIPYRNGVGQWEGVVAHSTAVYGDTAEGERLYECSHHDKAFVHAFCDPLGTLETADPNYLAFGAGQIANQRYIHVELCQVRNDRTDASKEAFKASYDNWIDYMAAKLYERKLGVTTAKADGSGTLWQHYQVSQYLGGSTHIDPMDYLSTWNITWGNVVADVQSKYKEYEQMDELTEKIKAMEETQAKLIETVTQLEASQAKIPAPDWFASEFATLDLTQLVKEPLKPNVEWECIAVSIRYVNSLNVVK